MRAFQNYKVFILSFALTGILWSCSTEKDVALNRGYHNMTARFNGYYNAGVVIDAALETYRTAFPDEYYKLLPLEIYPTEKDAPSLYPEMDKGIEKCERVILRHSMPMQAKKKKDEELCRWIDDNWLVIAQAHFYKREYEMARQKFDYIQKTYVGEESVYEAQIWLAKTHIALGNYAEAKRILAIVESSMEEGKAHRKLNFIQKFQKKRDGRMSRQRRARQGIKEPAMFPKRLEVDYEATMADLYIHQGQYKLAIDHLENAIKVCKDKKKRARYMFVLAQLYQKTGDGTMATYYYTKVARSSAPYEMRFQAKINRALSATSGGAEIRKELQKMLRDEKNAEYRDQIYYALAEMDVRDGNDSGAIKNYSASVYWSVKNNRQKGISYLRLADMHFVDQEYIKAQKYYDSCVKVLPEDYEDYAAIKNKADGLSGLVFHYETMVYEDSVQMIAAMDPEAREKFLKQTLKDLEEAEALRKKQEQERLLLTQTKVNDQTTTAGSGSKWYFYNTKVRGGGFNDFRTQWGSRPLEDNWRRAEKNSFGSDIDETDSAATTSVKKDTLTVDDLMVNIPLTESAIDSSNDRLMNSLYMLGVIYKEQLKEENEAILYFKEVINRGIEHPRVLAAMYQLYLIYAKKGSGEAETYKQMILSRYPDSEIAEIMRDPEYLRKKQEEEKKELNEYAKTLIDYQQRYYGAVITKCNQVINNDTTNQYLNKYYLLKAFAISKTDPGNKTAISTPLQSLYDRDPESEEGKQAKIYLDQINAGQNIVEPDQNTAELGYSLDKSSQHFFVLVVPADAGSTETQKIKLSNFNSEFFRGKRYTVINTVLNDNTQLLIVKTFTNADEGNLYLSAFKSPTSRITIGNMASDFDIFLINSANFSTLTKKKETATYKDFYIKNYPQNF